MLPTALLSQKEEKVAMQLQLSMFLILMQQFAHSQIARMIKYNRDHSFNTAILSQQLAGWFEFTAEDITHFKRHFLLDETQCSVLFDRQGAQGQTTYRATQLCTSFFHLLALLHDCGKPNDPKLQAIYRQTDGLTADQHETQTRHVHFSVKAILARSQEDDVKATNWEKLVQLLVLAAQDHHEAYDGSGYPSKKRSTEISWPGRWMKVIDYYEARTGKRPYQINPPSPEDVIGIMNSSAQATFDPRMLLHLTTCFRNEERKALFIN